MRHVAVVDIGKSNAKVVLVDVEALSEVAIRRMPNRTAAEGPYPHHDVDAIWNFVLESLAALGREWRVDAISVATHGATAALLDRDGALALPVLDYEHDAPETHRADYDTVRPSFAETGSPALPAGLNLGAQFFWQARAFPEAFAAVRSILMYPQYWTFRLTGVAASEATSLGCHTDLWNPRERRFSMLVEQMGWADLFPPLRRAADFLGQIRPDIARRTGLDASTPVLCGIHDSNASLLPHLSARRPPFAVVSTGTWVVAMAIGGAGTALDPTRDTLVNVNAHGEPVPSARFMGGREYEILAGGGEATSSPADVEAVLGGGIMLMPAVQPGCGPFPRSRSHWMAETAPGPGERAAAAAFYLALMTATCLDLIGAHGETVVEGPFAGNALYVTMLRAATGRPVVSQPGRSTGTSIGAALLAAASRLHPDADGASPGEPDPSWRSYAQSWRKAAGAGD